MEAARPATIDDSPAVVGLARQAVAELSGQRGGAVWCRREARPEPLEPELEATIAGAVPGSLAVVGTVDGVVVGYGVLTLERLHDDAVLGVVSDLYVDPEARGVGVGEAMMDLLVDQARRAGAVGIDAVALPGDRQTKNFFETFGLTARAIVVHRPLGGAPPGAAPGGPTP